MMFEYKTQGTCSRLITIDYDPNTHLVNSIRFNGGCPGNTQGVARLCAGKKLEEVKELLSDIKCGLRPTSCPDQLAKACSQILDTL